MRKPPVHHHLLTFLLVLSWHDRPHGLVRGQGQGQIQAHVQEEGQVEGQEQGSPYGESHPSCPQSCNCSYSPFPSFPTSLFTLHCTTMDRATVRVSTANATQALMLPHSHLTNLSSLPPLPHLRVLDLSYNHITCSECRQVFQLPHMAILIHLSLRANVIRHLENDSFGGLRSLRVLDLSYNNLTVMEPDAFRGLQQLTVLHLQYNHLYELRPSWLVALTLLRELYVQGNYLSVIDSHTFRHTPSLLQVDLSNNALGTVSDQGFEGLQHVKMLNLSHNPLVTIPTRQLQTLSSVLMLLMDAIQVRVLEEGDFTDLNVSSISLSYLPHLSLVAQGAFSNLTQLRTLLMHDNYRLLYIHPHSFHHLPLLHRLVLHNNQLVALSSGVPDSLPNLDELHLYHNPLHCDCNVWWLRQAMMAMDDSMNSSVDSYLPHWDKVMCSSPSASASQPLSHLALHLLPPVCSPTSLPFFSDSYHVTVGDQLSLRCQALGVPEPVLSWILPDGQVVNSSTDTHHLISSDNAVLSIGGVHLADQGTYSCRADNSEGYDISSTVVRVHNKDLHLSLTHSPNNHVIVTWTGSVPRQQMGQYQIVYSLQGDSNFSSTIYLQADMDHCTLTDLRPLTLYQVCLLWRGVFTVTCVNVTTHRHVLLAPPTAPLTTLTTSVLTASAVVVLVVTLYVARWIRRRRRQRKKKSDCVTEDKEMEKILLEPIDQRVPDSPQCTPRTALLPRSYV